MRRCASFLIALIFISGGCASAPKLTQEQIAAADAGPYPTNYQQLITEYYGRNLKDPEGARYRFNGEPQKAVVYKTMLEGGGVERFGWLVDFQMNGKNSFGAYVGYKHKRAIIRDGVVHSLLTEEDIDDLSRMR